MHHVTFGSGPAFMPIHEKVDVNLEQTCIIKVLAIIQPSRLFRNFCHDCVWN